MDSVTRNWLTTQTLRFNVNGEKQIKRTLDSVAKCDDLAGASNAVDESLSASRKRAMVTVYPWRTTPRADIWSQERCSLALSAASKSLLVCTYRRSIARFGFFTTCSEHALRLCSNLALD